jgi:opacity protein-like surface antigen
MNMNCAATVASACLGIAVPSQAAESGFYVSAEVAVIEPTVGESDGLTVQLPGRFPVHVDPVSTTVGGSEVGWTTTLGYRVSRHLAGELAYADFGAIDIEENYDLADAFPFPVDPPVAFNHTASHVRGPVISLIGILPVGEGFEAFARAGMLFASQEVNLTGGPGVFRGPRIDYAEELWVLGVGIDCAVTRKWKARFEYQAVERIPENAITGSIRLDRFSFGVAYDF